jgi:type II secretory ATPase GspE/PulE/Tfp pilus assembly ATPase PilB-like protein
MAVGELLVTNERVRSLILGGADEAAIQAGAGGMTAMFDNGLRELVRGTTTLEELMRNLRAED